MAHPRYSKEEIVRRGETIYSKELHDILEPAHRGEFVVLDIDTGDYEIDADETAALVRAMTRNPDGARYIKRIGYATAHRLGSYRSIGRGC